jgi:pyruvate dehydrogenase E2 component (dihydrolipoamide acetyltransferase)
VRPAGERPAASPAARAAARRAGVDLALVEGTGRRGRVTASDVAAVGAADGAGDTAVVLHGLFDDARGWRDLPRRLARAGLAVQAPDLPGHGAGAPAVPDLAAAEAALAAALPAGRLVLVGHSLGAALAVRLARALGPRVARLVLIAPAGIGARISADFVEGVLAAATPAALRRALALLDGGPMSETALQTELDRLAPLRAGLAALAGEVADGGFQQIDATADLARLTCDVAVVFGTADRVLDWRDVANLPARVAIHLVAGAGHLPHLAEPELIVRLAAGPSRARREAALG